MSVEFETGYTLPGADEPLTHARILHKGNRIRMKSLVASDTAALDVSVLDNALTNERWKPFSNQLDDPNDFSASTWTDTALTVGSDGLTLTETAANSQHKLQQSFTFTAVEWVYAVRLNRQTVPEVQILANDGGDNSVFFDLRDGTVGTASGAVGDIVDLGDDEYLLRIYWTALAAAGNVQILMSNGSEVTTYAGDITSTVQVLEAVAHPSVATVDFTPFTSEQADMFCIASHNLSTSAGIITIAHGAAHTDIMGASITPTDNEPVMAIFEPLTPTEWRLTVSRAVLPQIGVVRWGKALQMQRPVFGGHEPMALSRNTVMRANKSTTGEWLGQTTLRTSRSTSFSWSNIDDDWTRTNWVPFQKAAEREPFFLAWRPITYSEAGYCSISKHKTPSNAGVRALMSLSLDVTGFLNVE